MALISNFINGQAAQPASGSFLDVVEPATGQIYTRVPDSGVADVDAAVAAAKAAFPAWAATPTAERSRISCLADLIDANLEPLARAESIDCGKPISLARSVDIPRAAANFRFFATAILHTSTDFHDFDGGSVPASQGGVHALNYTLRKPRGVAGLISPWNLPLYLLTWKIAPALATGNTAVCKPSEVTPVTAHMLGDLANQVGIPAGVLNIVHGRGDRTGAAIVQHADVPTISFTGSTAVGRWIGREAGERLKRVSLELGGKNAFIVFDDVNLESAIETAVRAAFTNQGQVCLCGSRFLVHKGIYKRFLTTFVERTRALKIGDPLDTGTQQGALVSRTHLEKVDGYVRMAREMGGTIHCGGGPVAPESLPPHCKSGYFYQPTVISGLDPACPVEQEEIFGPVVTFRPIESEDEAVGLANGTPYGLVCTILSNDVSRAHRLAERLDSGIVWVNCWLVRDLRTPFGGAKQSGVGREGGSEAIRFFTEPKNVCVRI